MAREENFRFIILESHGLIADCQPVPTSLAGHDDEDDEGLLLRRVFCVENLEVEGHFI